MIRDDGHVIHFNNPKVQVMEARLLGLVLNERKFDVDLREIHNFVIKTK